MSSRKVRLVLGTVVLGALVLGSAASAFRTAAAPPERLNHQGVLRDQTGQPLNGTFNMVYRLFTAPTAGEEILVDSHLASGSGGVVVTSGLFNVAIGTGVVTDGSGPGVYTSLSGVFTHFSPVYLEVTVNGETLTPRTPVSSVPYALAALDAQRVDGKPSTDFLNISTDPQTKDGPLTLRTLFVGPAVATGTAVVLDVAGGISTDAPLKIRVADGVSPFAVTSTALVANLNADLLDGLSSSAFSTAVHDHDSVYVNTTGDTMTGPLSMRAFNGPQTVTLSADSLSFRGFDGPDPVSITADALSMRAFAGPHTATFTADALSFRAADFPHSVTVSADSLAFRAGEDDYLALDGGGPSVFAPRISGSVEGVSPSALWFDGRVAVDSGVQPVVRLRASTAQGGALAVRPVFQVSNADAPALTVGASGQVAVPGSIVTDAPLVLRVAAGVAPMSVSSTAVVANLNADMVDGLSASDIAASNHNHDEVYVNTTGDTMTGPLSLRAFNGPQTVTLSADSLSFRGFDGPNPVTFTADAVSMRAFDGPHTVTFTAASLSFRDFNYPSVATMTANAVALRGGPGDFIALDGGGPSVFAPRIAGSATGVTVTAVWLDGRVAVDSGVQPVVRLQASTAQGGALSVRPVFQVSNADAPALTVGASGQVAVPGSIVTDAPLVLRAAAGVAPMSVSSTAVVANLNADMVDGLSASDIATSNHNHDAVYVNTTGDTMTGPLSFGAFGLPGGTTMTAQSLSIRAFDVPVGVSLTASSLAFDAFTTPRGVTMTANAVVLRGGPGDFIALDGGETSVFEPRIAGFASPVSRTALKLDARVLADAGALPVVRLQGSTAQGGALAVRPVFQVTNADTPALTVEASGHVAVPGSIVTDAPLVLRAAAGTAPINVTSTAVVANLNADLLDGMSASDFAPGTHGHDGVYVRTTGDTMTGPLSLVGVPDPTGGGQPFLHVSALDAPGASLTLDNGSSVPGAFVPRFSAVGSVTQTAIEFDARVAVDEGKEPAVTLRASTLQGTSLAFRPVFQITNNDAPALTVEAPGLVRVPGSIISDSTLFLRAADGVAPIAVTSTAVALNFNADMVDGFHASQFAPALHEHDAQYVNVTGDAMTGGLSLPTDGLHVGTNQLNMLGGNVGLGTFNPIFGVHAESATGALFRNVTTNARAYLGGGTSTSRSWGVEAYGTFNAASGSGGGGFFKDMVTGNFAAVGQNVSKILGTGSVSFVQNHPYEKDKVIVYTAPEGDEAAVYTRGTARLVNGEARISLGKTLQWVANPDVGLTAYVTPRGEAVPLAVVSVTPSELLVRAPEGSTSSAVFDYIVYGLRIGFEETNVVVPKTEEAYIPSMVNERARDAARPELRTYNALERFKAAEGSAKAIDAFDMTRSAALKAAIGEYDPAIHGTSAGAPAPVVDARGATEVEPRSAQAPSTAVVPPDVAAAVPEGERDAYARSFRPSAPDLAGFVAVSEEVSAGDVLVADRNNPGAMKLAEAAGDPAVVGIVSGQPGVALGAGRAGAHEAGKAAVAFTGIISCKVDASYGAIQVGDLLTTSATKGHAMRADDPAPGTILGKALEPLPSGTGVIKVLVMLR
ncbi:MAG TPA: hypothetical protein VJ826_13415 [Candidatus Polarisedimenticolaceae bacterium]|nr:hypothetical protein [Candidatus Polarisedimenticolaceae bacterium]